MSIARAIRVAGGFLSLALCTAAAASEEAALSYGSGGCGKLQGGVALPCRGPNFDSDNAESAALRHCVPHLQADCEPVFFRAFSREPKRVTSQRNSLQKNSASAPLGKFRSALLSENRSVKRISESASAKLVANNRAMRQ